MGTLSIMALLILSGTHSAAGGPVLFDHDGGELMVRSAAHPWTPPPPPTHTSLTHVYPGVDDFITLLLLLSNQQKVQLIGRLSPSAGTG